MSSTPETYLSPSGPRVALTPRQGRLVLCLLGTLTVITPLSIDMYLPAFGAMARDFQAPGSMIAVSVATYFFGVGLGQILYGPVLDRFGRKIPLSAGLILFIISCVGCAVSRNVESLLFFRFLQGLGGCSAQISSTAMVRDFFPAGESSRIFSLLYLFIGVSPLLAPTMGGLLSLYAGWPFIFYVLGAIALIVTITMALFLPEGHQPDPSISLRPGPIVREFGVILRQPQFFTYTFAGALSGAGLLAYIAGSPTIFIEGYKLSPQIYSIIFAVLACGFIGGSQCNVFLLRWFSTERIFFGALVFQSFVGLVFAIGSCLNWYSLSTSLPFYFLIITSVGITNPNSAALALNPFRKNVGSAASLLGFSQTLAAATLSVCIGFLGTRSSLPIVLSLSLVPLFGLATLFLGLTRIAAYRTSYPNALAEAEKISLPPLH